jgi:DNA (cytosine-5)-methyltransferase 1
MSEAERFNVLKVLDLFSGIGGFSIGLERTGGFETVAFCEIEPFPRKVLAKHWPEVPIYDDVRTLTADRLAADGIAVDVICGGFPCQDISTAGKGAGLAGERSGLFFEITRLVGELGPRFVILENVSALLGRGLADVLGTLASLGYDAEWHCIPASYIGAPHRRDRIWIVAYPNSRHDAARFGTAAYPRAARASQGSDICEGEAPFGERIRLKSGKRRQDVADAAFMQRDGGNDNTGSCVECQVSELGNDGGPGALADANRARLEGWSESRHAPGKRARFQQLIERRADSVGQSWASEPDVGRVANGVPDRAHRLKGLGNAVVPQIPELIGRAILDSIDAERIAA